MGRDLTNMEDVQRVLAAALGRSCPLTTAVLQGPVLDQVKLVANVTWLISVSGSGSHQVTRVNEFHKAVTHALSNTAFRLGMQRYACAHALRQTCRRACVHKRRA